MSKRFFSTPRYLQKRHELLTPTSKKSRAEWVVSRGLCHYRLFELTEIPMARRTQVLPMKIKQWSPFVNYGSYQVWQGGKVQVWIWDQAVQRQLVADTGLKKATILPETLLRTRTSEGVQLIECLDGVEGQIWKAGLLIGSRWWEHSPNAIDWDQFQRAHGLPATITMPPVIESALLAQPWGKHKMTGGNSFGMVQERMVIMAGITVFSMMLTWQTVSNLKWRQALAGLQTQIDELSQTIEPILTARNQALADRQQFEKIVLLNQFPSPIELIAQVAEKLPPEAKLLEWSYQLGNLSFIVESAQPDPTFYVTTFQEVSWFKEVKAETGSGRKANQIVVSMQIKLEQ